MAIERTQSEDIHKDEGSSKASDTNGEDKLENQTEEVSDVSQSTNPENENLSNSESKSTENEKDSALNSEESQEKPSKEEESSSEPELSSEEKNLPPKEDESKEDPALVKSEETETTSEEGSEEKTDKISSEAESKTIDQSDTSDTKDKNPGSDLKSESTEKTDQTDGHGQSSNESSNEDHDEENDLDHDHEEQDDHDHDEEFDFSKFSKKQAVQFIKDLLNWDNPVKADRVAHELKERVDELHDEDKQKAHDKFISEGGEEVDFAFKPDDLLEEFEANFRLLRDKKSDFRKKQERSKQENLAKAEDILERLREFLDSDESNTSFSAFKEFQNEWKSLGQFPPGTAKTLWANYNALVSRFYDARSIYYELKELDRKKNLEYKLELCKKAEELADNKNLKEAIMQLNDLHHEFKHTGPVPQEEQEAVWLRFKAASDTIYAKRKEYNAEIKEQLKGNIDKKLAVIDKVLPFAEFNSDRIKEWNSKTKEILSIQKEWESIGPVPKENAKEINKKFWGNFKTYFHNKNKFFKGLEKLRKENLKLKEELVQKAEELKDSEDWEKTANALKQLQRDWKEIGPVPEKVRNSIYEKFKKACDHFFDRRREALHVSEKDFEENLKLKEAVISEIEGLTQVNPNDLDTLYSLIEKYHEIGFVPKKSIKSILKKFNTAVDQLLNAADKVSEEDKEKIRIENKVERLKHAPNAGRKIHQQEQNLRKQISKIENDISVWKNNIEFFANTKNGDKYRDEFGEKIDKANQELDHLKKELRMLRQS